MRCVIIPGIVESSTLRRGQCTSGQTPLGAGLMPAHQAFQHVVRRRKYIPHIVKNGESESLSQIRQRHCGETQLEVIHEYCRAADRETRRGIARSCLIQPESTMRVAAAREEL